MMIARRLETTKIDQCTKNICTFSVIQCKYRAKDINPRKLAD